MSASADGPLRGTLKVWDAATGRERTIVAGHTGGLTACAISPDGTLIVSVSAGGAIKAWDAATGGETASLPPGSGVCAIAAHPLMAGLAVGNGSGDVLFVDLVGVNYGPLVATPIDRGAGAVVRCPACRHEIPLLPEWLGQTIACPNPGCSRPLRVNPFVTRMRPLLIFH